MTTRRCSPRRRFRTAWEADEALGRIWSGAFQTKGTGRLPSRAYLCQICQSFHLTDRPTGEAAMGEVLSEPHAANPVR